MTSATQHEYPKRPPFFANRLIRLLQKSCAANEIGIESCWLVTCIALIEDAKRYSGPVSFWTGQLLPISGFNSWGRLDRSRQRAVNAGWLHYVPGTNRQAATYWTNIPPQIEAAFDDAPVDEGNHQNVERQKVNHQNRAQNGERTVIEIGSKRGSSIPTPMPFPKELATARFSFAWDQWIQHRKEIRKPVTPTSTSQQLKKLAAWGEDRAIAAIEHTIASGWQGIREPEATDRQRQRADDWQHVQQIVRTIYSPDLKNSAAVQSALTPEQWQAVQHVTIRRVADWHPADKETPALYRRALAGKVSV